MKVFRSLLHLVGKVKDWFLKRSLTVKILLIAVVILVFWFSGQKIIKSANNQPQYSTATVEKGSLVSSVSASGQVVIAGTVTVTTQSSGMVKQVYVQNGQKVTAGEKLLEMELDQTGKQRQTQAWASYLSAKNSLESAQTQLYTLQSDMLTKWKDYMDIAQSSEYQNSDKSPRFDQRALPEFMTVDDDWLAAEAKYKNQQNVIAQAQASVASSWATYQATSPTVTAPVAGTVGDITLVTGMTLNNQTTSGSSINNGASSVKIATIKTESEPIAQFNLSEIDVLKVKEGQKATMTIDSFPDKTFTGEVAGVDHTGTVTSGVTNYPVTIRFDTKNDNILPNMSSTANIIVEVKNDVLKVPSIAVQSQNGESFVRVLKDGQVQEEPVVAGISSSSDTEITSGLKEGDKVITSIITSGSQGSSFSSQRGGIGVFRGGGFGGGGRD